jgi:hypothetical protein
MTDLLNRARALGFEPYATGGDCMALRRLYPEDGSYHLITMAGGPVAPDADTPPHMWVRVGLYNADSAEPVADDYTTTWEDCICEIEDWTRAQ